MSFPGGREDVSSFIQANLPLTPAPSRPDILLHIATPTSGLRRLLESAGSDAPPYWAYPWAGGLVLARYLADHPELVADRRVLDLGCGSGLVAIAVALSGARMVHAIDIDARAVVATTLNAAANSVTIAVEQGDAPAGPTPPVDLILVGDLFYAPVLAERVTVFLLRCVEAGVEVVVGDPGRVSLPYAHLTPLARYPTLDVGDARDGEGGVATVYAFTADA